jgi:ABC-type nitrate/sulfonate/bicarbonate transport system permease component
MWRRNAVKTIASYVILLALWEFAGDLHLVAQGALPSPSAILAQGWDDRAVYPPHIAATLQPALFGFIIGNLIAAAAALAFVLAPAFEGLMRGVNIAIFGIPPIALSPVLVVTLPGTWPQIVLASVGVYFPTMVLTLLGLRDIDPRPIDVIRCYGGGEFAVLRWLRIRACVPGFLSGLRVAAPAAILGAILAEFGSGARWGLGSFLLGSLGRGNPARIWGIGLTATLMAALAYGVCALLGRRFSASLASVTLAGGTLHGRAARGAAARAFQVLLGLAACGVPFLLWWGVLKGFGVSPVIAKTPLAVWQYLVSAPDAAESRAAILQALKESLPLAGTGLLIALIFALGLAVLGMLWSALTSTLMPAALILQTMPLVALTPMIVLLFGRGIAATLIITVLVTFFPAFITIAQGLSQVPRASLDVLTVYGANRRQKLALVSLPMSMPYLCAAARLVAPASLLGVMIAEWLATGYGLGNLLNTARGELDYGMIWAVAFVAVAVSVGFYQVVKLLEQQLLRRYAATEGTA